MEVKVETSMVNGDFRGKYLFLLFYFLCDINPYLISSSSSMTNRFLEVESVFLLKAWEIQKESPKLLL